MALVNSTDANECQWFYTITKGMTKSGDLYYILDNILIPEQEVSAAAVESPSKGMASLYQELKTIHKKEDGTPDMEAIQQIFSTMHAWCHSHVNMGVTPSQTDNTTFNEWIAGNKADNCNSPVMMIIVNKREEIYVRLFDPEAGILCENPTLEIWMPTVDTSHIVAQSKAKIKQRVWQHTTGPWNGYQGGYLGGTSHRLLGAEDPKKKSTALQESSIIKSLRNLITIGSEKVTTTKEFLAALEILKVSAGSIEQATSIAETCISIFPNLLNQYILLCLLKSETKNLVEAKQVYSAAPWTQEKIKASFIEYFDKWWADGPETLYVAIGATHQLSLYPSASQKNLTRMVDYYLDCIEMTAKDTLAIEGEAI